MTTGYLIAYRNFSFHRDIYLDRLDHPRGQLIAFFDLVDLVLIDKPDKLDLVLFAVNNLCYPRFQILIAKVYMLDLFKADQIYLFSCQRFAFLDGHPSFFILDVSGGVLAGEKLGYL